MEGLRGTVEYSGQEIGGRAPEDPESQLEKGAEQNISSSSIGEDSHGESKDKITVVVESVDDEANRVAVEVSADSEEPKLESQKSSEPLECRICLERADKSALVQPCACMGSVSYAHLPCLKKWVRERGSTKCEICNEEYKKDLMPELEEDIEAGRKELEARAARRRSSLQQVVAAALLADVAAVANGQSNDVQENRIIAVVSPDRGPRSPLWKRLFIIFVFIMVIFLGFSLFAAILP